MSAVVDVRDVFCLHPLADGGAVAALRGLSLQVAPGERLVVHGPNGSGKTTLLKVLAGEQRLAAGRAVVAGQDLAGAGARPLAAWRSRQLGQVDQNAGRLLRPEFDVLDNVSLQLRLAGVSRTAARATGLASLERLGLADLAHRRPGTLSGGQRQRVAVCAALAHGPELVLADEPTGELDLASADAVYDLLGSAVRDAGATLVLVTHDRRAARIADRVVRIRDGRISETWHPGSGGESLVVDPRGWVRLPLALRRSLALGSSVSAEPLDGTLVLSPTHPSRTTPAPLPATEEVWTETPARRDQKSSVAGVVRAGLKGVVVGYDGRNVLDGVDLSVRAGELVVVAGRSGAGKSTLLRVLLGLQRPDAGTVHLDGVDLTGLDRSALAALRAATTAVVMQQIHLADTADAAGNLDLARAARRLPADPGLADLLAARLGLAGLAAVGGRPVSGLSGGERQRLAVARALAVEPALLVLDEPTSQLDETSAELMALTLRQAAASGTAVLVASHDPVLLAAADEVQELP